MMLVTVKLVTENHLPLDRKFIVLMSRIPADSEKEIEIFHDEIREKVRNHSDFIAIESNLPFRYNMDIDVVLLDDNFVGVLSI